MRVGCSRNSLGGVRSLPCSILLLGVAAICGLPSAKAQLQSDSTHKITAIEVEGSKRFAAEDVIAASGLRIGTIVTDEDFKKAARQLGETGAFSDVAFHYSYNAASTKLIFQVTDAAKFVPARFQDFVWFTSDELQKFIKFHVPLFDGELPLGGNMAGQVSDALQTQLVLKAVPGYVQYERYSKADGPVEAFVYSVTNVIIRIQNFEFAGAQEPELSLLKEAAGKMPNEQYSGTGIEDFIQQELLPIYHARGYLKAAFSPPQPKVVAAPKADAGGDSHTTFVDVGLTVTPGEQYTLSKIEWLGNRAIPTETLQGMVVAPLGKPVDTVKLRDELAAVRTLYQNKGYMLASIKANADFNDAAHTVEMVLAVDEDAVYHMGDLQYRGLDNLLMAKLRDAWTLQKGDVYDASYLKKYLRDTHKLLPTNFDWDIQPHVTANVDSKTVDVDLQYIVKATPQ